MEITKKGEFVELNYTGYVNENVFDSNIAEDLKKIKPDAKPDKTVIAIGEGMIVKGLDNALEGKELGKEYSITLKPNEGFGERRKELVKTIPLKTFTERNVMPRAGMMLALDDSVVKIAAVSGARVIVDFNNPLAGKEIKYKFVIKSKVEDVKEKSEALLKALFKFVPEFEIKGDKIIIKGPAILEHFVKHYKEKFKQLLDKELIFEEKKSEKEQKSEIKQKE